MGPAQSCRETHTGLRIGAIGRQRADKDHVRLLFLHDFRKNLNDRGGTGIFERIVPNANASFSALRQAAAQDVLRVVGAHRHRNNLDAVSRFHDLKRRLVGIVVPLIRLEVQKVGIDILAVVAKLEVLVDHTDLLHRYQDLHSLTLTTNSSSFLAQFVFALLIRALAAVKRTCGSGSPSIGSRSETNKFPCLASMARLSG